jgi:hypothetical protein
VKLSDAQLHLARKLSADATLAALGAPLVYDPQRTTARVYSSGTDTIIDDPSGATLADAIKARLQATAGIAVEIDWPIIGAAANTAGGTFSRVFVPIFIAERSGTTHSPTGLALVDRVIDALRARSGSAWLVEVTDYAFDDDDAGAVLHILTASIATRHG